MKREITCDACDRVKSVKGKDETVGLLVRRAGWTTRQGHVMCDECASDLPTWETADDHLATTQKPSERRDLRNKIAP